MKLESLIILLSKFSSNFKKCLPPPNFYKINSFKKIKRDKVKFKVDISDYMQWYLFADIRDNSWIHAYDCFKTKKSRSNIIDIGSNVGAFTIKLANKCFENKRKYKIYAFEPNKNIFKLFKNNINLNKNLSNSIKPYELALGNSNKDMDFFINKGNSGGSKLIKKSLDLSSQTQTVKQITLDDFVEKNNIEFVDFIKIDVEGHECFVLDGSYKTLKKFKPDLYIEISPEWFKELGRSSSELLDSLESMGYIIFVDETTHLRNLNQFDKLPDRNQYNILAKHKN